MDHSRDDQKQQNSAIQAHTPTEPKLELVCDTCRSEGVKSTFKTMRTLCFHLNRQGHTSSAVPECELCGQAFQSEEKLKHHVCPLQPGLIPLEPGYFGRSLPQNTVQKEITNSSKYQVYVTSLDDILAKSGRPLHVVQDRVTCEDESGDPARKGVDTKRKQKVKPEQDPSHDNVQLVVSPHKNRAPSTLSPNVTKSVEDILAGVLRIHEQQQHRMRKDKAPDGLSSLGGSNRSTTSGKPTVQLSTPDLKWPPGVPRLKQAPTFTSDKAIAHNTLPPSPRQWLLQQSLNIQHNATTLNTSNKGNNTATTKVPTHSTHTQDISRKRGSPLFANNSPQSQYSITSSMAPLPRFMGFETTPPRDPHNPKCNIVALDCEMVKIITGASELARLSVVDASTGETLIDSLVLPDGFVINWLTSISGVSAEILAEAVANGTALHGWRAARAELWKYVDADTVIVGHALHNDFNVLRLTHFQFWDSAIIAKNAVGGTRNWGLKQLCLELLGHHVQVDGQPHDSVQDAHAAIHLVSWLMSHPQELEAWAASKRIMMLEDERRRSEERKTRRLGSNDFAMGRVAS